MQLKGISFKELLLSRLKKLILDMTSVKFETLVFVTYGMWVDKIDTIPGLAYMAAAVGIKEFADFKEKQQVLSNGEYLKKGGG
jgi:hypothetical protein